jgi:hypothetical protein
MGAIEFVISVRDGHHAGNHRTERRAAVISAHVSCL